MNSKKKIIAIGVSGMIFTGIVAAQTFTDEKLWQSATGSFSLESFDKLGTLGTPITSLPNLGVKLNNTAYIYDSSSGGSMVSRPYSLINIYPYNSSSLHAISFSSASQDKLITAVGVWNTSSDDQLDLRFYDTSNALIESLVIGAGYPAFGGIINSQGAARVEIGGTGNANLWITIDNLQVTLTQPDSVGGSIIGETGGNVNCQNLTTKKSVVISLKGTTSWNCGAAGLVIRSGDVIKQAVIGKAN